MLESGIAYNDLVDNETNGWQFYLALVKVIQDTAWVDDSVESAQIVNLSVETAKIAADAITWDKVATPLDSSITDAGGYLTGAAVRRTSAGATQLIGTCNRGGASPLPTTLGTIVSTGSNNRPTTLTRCVCPSTDGSSTCVLEISTLGVITMLAGSVSTDYDMTGVMYISN